MQFDLLNWHQESDLWFCWIVGQFFCLMYPLKLGDNFCQIDDRSVPVPRFEALCLKSSAIGWFGDVVSWCYSTPEISSDVRTCWNTGYDRCSKAWFWSFSPAWEAVELTKESCIHLFVRGPHPDLGATLVAPGHMLGDFPHPRRSLLPFMISH